MVINAALHSSLPGADSWFFKAALLKLWFYGIKPYSVNWKEAIFFLVKLNWKPNKNFPISRKEEIKMAVELHIHF